MSKKSQVESQQTGVQWAIRKGPSPIGTVVFHEPIYMTSALINYEEIPRSSLPFAASTAKRNRHTEPNRNEEAPYTQEKHTPDLKHRKANPSFGSQFLFI